MSSCLSREGEKEGGREGGRLSLSLSLSLPLSLSLTLSQYQGCAKASAAIFDLSQQSLGALSSETKPKFRMVSCN